MSDRVIFTVEKGSLSGKVFAFDCEETLVLGRRKDCSIIFDDDTVSGRHCIVTISRETPMRPLSVAVNDCGSMNGTYINGEKIGQRVGGSSGEIDGSESSAGICTSKAISVKMKSGDILGLGKSCELRLEIEDVQRCAICDAAAENVSFRTPDGEPICDTCHSEPEKVLRYLIDKSG